VTGDPQAAGARYRLVDHAPEGRTDLVSALRGHDVAHAAKCLVVMVKIGKKRTRYVLAVVPGDARLDLQAVKALLGGTYATFASRDRAEELAGSVSGTVELEPRQAFAVTAGMRHRPVVPVRSAVLMIEKAGVVATGD
jgi:Ala-tRNA(Pro) deacylase